MVYNAKVIESQRIAQIKVNQGVSLGENKTEKHYSLKLSDLFPWISRFQHRTDKRDPHVIHDEVDVKLESE